MTPRNEDAVSGSDWLGLLLQTLLAAGAVIEAISVQIEWRPVAALSLMGAGLVALQTAPGLAWSRLRPARWAIVSGFSMCFGLSLLETSVFWKLTLWGVAALILAAARMALINRGNDSAIWKARLRLLVFFWAGCFSIIWLCIGYARNFSGVFYFGLLSILALLTLCRSRLPQASVKLVLVNTLFFLLAGLPSADLIYKTHHDPEIRPETFRDYYSYDRAKGNPGAFVLSQKYMADISSRLSKDIYERASEASTHVRLRPNSHGVLMNCPISINSKGFRGPEIAEPKGDIYRIVALGESTTFGLTFEPGDKPWPELLEQMIRERLKTRRPVEVINAGVIAYTILDNLRRLPGQILPLKPDMIISYHGANGFYFIDPALLKPTGSLPVPYQERPIKLAADFENRARLMHLRSAELKALSKMPVNANPLETKYADAYRELIQVAATNHIRLMLANYSMAVNETSGPGVIAFYQRLGDSARGKIRANGIHSQIIQQLARQYPQVGLIDTHPHLDGEHEKFTDTMHLTQEGRQQLAENIFAGIKKTLEDEIGR